MLGSPGAGFSNYDTLITSSGLDRTLLSAAAFLEGAFFAGPAAAAAAGPAPPQRAPVYSSPDRGDWRIRGYTKCPAYEARLLAWFASDEFTSKEAASAALRQAVGALKPGLDVSLKNWWNGGPARGWGGGGVVGRAFGREAGAMAGSGWLGARRRWPVRCSPKDETLHTAYAFVGTPGAGSWSARHYPAAPRPTPHPVYDGLNVWRKHGAGDPMPNVTDDQFQEASLAARRTDCFGAP
jgi:hypothetical protein